VCLLAAVSGLQALAPSPTRAEAPPGAAAPLAADSPAVTLARYPAVSPDGRTVAFSYQGDLFTAPVGGGTAGRLTVNPGYDGHPSWSPDGGRIAFSSDRFGNEDVFVVDADGGGLRRLTWHSADDVPGGWTPDGRIAFQTRRTYLQVEWEREIYTVSASGGTPDRWLDATGFEPRPSPDGRFLAFVFGSNPRERKGYHGSANRNLWVYDTQAGRYVQVTDFEGNDQLPRWVGPRTLLFLSERSGRYDLFRVRIGDDGKAAGEPERLTRYDDYGATWFGASADGSVVVLERPSGLERLSLGAGSAGPEGGRTPAPEPIALRIPQDGHAFDVERKTFTDEADELAVSPNGKEVAFAVHGELFVTTADPEERRTVRLTRTPYRERDVGWLDDTTLVFASDRDGDYDLYRLASADTASSDLLLAVDTRTGRLTDTDVLEREPVVSPDGKRIAFRRGPGTLVVADVGPRGLGDEKTLLDGWAAAEDVAWSPDGRWLAYDRPDLDFNTEVYVLPSDGSGQPVDVSQHPRPDRSPVWSPDGSKLAFVSNRNNGDDDVWFAWLRKDDWEKTKADWDLERVRKSLSGGKGAGGDTAASGNGKEGGAAAEGGAGPVRIDLDGIWERLSQVTSLPGNESDPQVSEDGTTFYFVSNRDGRQSWSADQNVYRVKWDGSELKALTTSNPAPRTLRMGPDGKRLYMLMRRGTLARLDAESGKQESLAFSARMELDHRTERGEVFDEAWRLLNRRYYDPDFHGADWKALHDRYRPWAVAASTSRDFADIFNLLLGELNSSHVGFYSPSRGEREEERTGLLGVEVTPVEAGVRVDRVVPRSPAARETSRLEPGDVITAVDGESVPASGNFYSLLVDRAGERTVLDVTGPDGRARRVLIRPTSSLSDDLYREWVDARRRLTEEYSGGRLGYIHVEAMNWPSFERFERELTAAGEGKDGLVIDVRFNGGGWTTDYLLDVLTYRQHAYTIPRGAADSLDATHTRFRDHYPFGERLPLAGWTKPTVALANENSYSNAEIFAHAYKTLGLGTLVGEPTFGAVISTGGAGLLDGSFVRLPFRGWYVKATDHDMELHPAVPDISIPRRPNDRADGEDAQLRAAVRELLGRIDGTTGGAAGGG